MKKIKSPYFTYPRMLPPGQALDKHEPLVRKLGGQQVLAIELFHLLQSCFEARAKVTIMDMICGTGESTRMIANVCKTRGYDAKIQGIDFHQGTIETARSKSADYPQIEYEKTSIGDWAKLSASSVDLITCCHGLHLLPLEKAVSLMEAIDRAAKTAWIVVDMKRTRMLTLITEAVKHWTPSNGESWQNAGPLTQQAFSGRELKNLAFHAGVSEYSWRTWLLHQVMIRHKR